MGSVSTISWNTFPKQSSWVGCRCRVSFQYDTEHPINGTIIRDDTEKPYLMLIRLDDGRTVRACECQYCID